tara:strand:+ start:756 stop:1511 length:756 start_codon:yes stop_codon:yes gene_type:complete
MNISDIKKELKLPEGQLGKLSAPKREDSVYEAIKFNSGISVNDKEYKIIYQYDNYTIGAEKPGKEINVDNLKYVDGKIGNNPNDMTPSIYKNHIRIDKNLSFTDIFQIFEKMMRDDEQVLEILGSLLFRQAFMLDHQKNDEENWRLIIPSKTEEFLNEKKSSIYGTPISVFIYLLEVLALNEDVKYYTLGYNVFSQGYGRRNNLLTCSHLIAVLLQKTSLWKFAGSLSRPPSGVAPLAQKNGKEFFSFLAG